uniref:Lipoprotein n=1 Tax=Arundo donax TaxID=35708 RepID=A0A0A9HHD2_ARUDO
MKTVFYLRMTHILCFTFTFGCKNSESYTSFNLRMG